MKAADGLIMGQHRSVALRLSKMQDKKSMILHGRSFVGGGRDIGSSIFTHKGSRNMDFASVPMPSTLSVHDAGPQIVDAPLTLIFRRW